MLNRLIHNYLLPNMILTVWASMILTVWGCGAKPDPTPQSDPYENQANNSNTSTSPVKKKPKINKAAKQVFLEAGRIASGANPNYNLAISMYEEAYAKDRNLKLSLYNIAYLYNVQKNKEKAVEYYKKAAEIGVGDAWVDIGLMQLEANNLGAAESSFNRALSVEPLNGRAHLNLAVIAKNRKQYNQAISSVRNALKEDGTNADAYAVLAQVYYDMKLYKLALLVSDAGLSELDPNHSGLLTTLGLIHLKLDNLIAAIKAFKEAIQHDKNNFSARLNLGLITFGYRDYEKSYNLLNQAVKIKPQHVEANLSLAVAARTMNRLDEARKGYEKVLALEPNHPSALFNLAVLQQDYSDIKDFDAQSNNIRDVIKKYEDVLNYARDQKLRKKVVQKIEDAKIMLEAIAAEKEMAASEAANKQQEEQKPAQ